jgi:hypothetical protein
MRNKHMSYGEKGIKISASFLIKLFRECHLWLRTNGFAKNMFSLNQVSQLQLSTVFQLVHGKKLTISSTWVIRWAGTWKSRLGKHDMEQELYLGMSPH